MNQDPPFPSHFRGKDGLAWMFVQEIESISARICPGHCVVEVGTAHGVTAAVLAERNPEATVISVDPFADCHGNDRMESKERRILSWWWNKKPNQHLWVGDLGSLAKTGFCNADLIFIDGDHSYESCKLDLVTAHGLIRPGGIIVAHDYGHRMWPGVTQACEEFCIEFCWEVRDISKTTAFMKRIPDED